MSSTREKTRRYSWTLMVYLAGDNNLSEDMVWALKEIYRVGPPDGVAITLQFDPLAQGRSTRFFRLVSPNQRINTDGLFSILPSKDLPDVDEANPDVLAKFVLDSMQAAPAEHYMLILSGHGAGVLGDFLTDNSARRSPTMSALGSMFQGLRDKLATGGAPSPNEPLIDVLGLDSCLMSMAETCSEIAGQVRYIVGSEGFDPNAGWPYFRLLEQLGQDLKDGIPDPATLAANLVQTYTLYYSDYVDAEISVDITSTRVDHARVRAIEDAVAEFAAFYLTAETDPIVRNAVVLAHWKAQSYKRELYTDLVDFCFQLQNECTLLLQRAPDPSLEQLLAICARIIETVRAAVSRTNVVGPEFQYSYGLSVYFPWSRDQFQQELYAKSAFAQRTKWGEFLARYVDGTRRSKRSRFQPVHGERTSGTNQLIIAGPSNRTTIDLGEVLSLRWPNVSPNGSRPSFYAGERAAEGPGSAIVRANGDGHRDNAPSNRDNAPSNRDNAPSNRDNAPSNRDNAPSNRDNAPSNRENFVSNRDNAPSNRFADIMSGLLEQLPSMKNPATDAEPMVQFVRNAQEIFQKLANKADRGANGESGSSRRSHDGKHTHGGNAALKGGRAAH